MQQFGVCNLSVVPLRAEPSDKSEMVSQLLFGDHFQILEKQEKWVHIKTAFEEYTGWIDRKQFISILWDEYLALNKSNQVVSLAVSNTIKKRPSGELIHLGAGSAVPEPKNNQLSLGGQVYELESALINPCNASDFLEKVSHYAYFYLNAPYLWGGKTLFGIDCSGFTQMVFRQFGIRLKRDAWQQAEQGEIVDFLSQAKAGDLAFFDNDEGRIIHVGIMLDHSRIIHASGRVKIDAIDNQGIYSEELKRYTHKLRIIKRYAS